MAKKIAVNAGHFPSLDSGAVGATGLQEADVVKLIAEKLCAFLEAVGYETLFIQDNELQNICDLANNFEADIFISIHCNAASNPAAKGTETWFCDGSEAGLKLATCIDAQVVSLGETDRGVKDAKPHVNGLYVLSNTNMTSVLLETAFISYPPEEALLATDDFQTKLAAAAARGITDFDAL